MTDNTEEKEEINPLDMPDEEAAELLLSDDDAVITPQEPTSTEETEESSEEEESSEDLGKTEESEKEGKEEEDSEGEEEENLAAKAEDTEQKEDPKERKDQRKSKEAAEETKADDTTTKVEETPKDIDYKAEYERLIAPFRANGKDMQIESVDDALTLMKMGANYNKKMAGLKPNLKLLKMLEKNNLLDESKLSFLIDLDQKNPGAVNKLIKDSGIDPLDIDTEKEDEYRPSTYTVDDKEVELDGVLDEIRDTQSFKDTLGIITNKWDDSSKQVLYDNPGLIKVINEHVGAGVYTKIAGVIESERMFGRLTNMTDLEAYKHVGDAIMAKGGFQTSTEQPDTTESTDAAPVTKKTDPKLNERRKAASSTKSASSSKKTNDFNPLAMSDEDFEKVSGSQFL